MQADEAVANTAAQEAQAIKVNKPQACNEFHRQLLRQNTVLFLKAKRTKNVASNQRCDIGGYCYVYPHHAILAKENFK